MRLVIGGQRTDFEPFRTILDLLGASSDVEREKDLGEGGLTREDLEWLGFQELEGAVPDAIAAASLGEGDETRGLVETARGERLVKGEYLVST